MRYFIYVIYDIKLSITFITYESYPLAMYFKFCSPKNLVTMRNSGAMSLPSTQIVS